MTSNIEEVSRRAVSNQGQEYRDYHAEFRRKTLCQKLWLIMLAMPRHLYYTYFAGENERYHYRALLGYLDRQRENMPVNK